MATDPYTPAGRAVRVSAAASPFAAGVGDIDVGVTGVLTQAAGRPWIERGSDAGAIRSLDPPETG